MPAVSLSRKVVAEAVEPTPGDLHNYRSDGLQKQPPSDFGVGSLSDLSLLNANIKGNNHLWKPQVLAMRPPHRARWRFRTCLLPEKPRLYRIDPDVRVFGAGL